MANEPIIGTMRVENVIYLALMDELLEERYSDKFIEMCNAVQEEVVMLTSHVPLETSLWCVQQKFINPQFSIKEGLIKAMKLPEKNSMS